MKQALILTLFMTAFSWAQTPASLAETLPAANGRTVEVDRGAFFTQSADYQGLKVQFQEGVQDANWTQLSTPESSLLDGPLRFSAAPRLMLDRDGRTGYGADLRVQLNSAVEVSHSAQFGGWAQHITTAKLAPQSAVSLKMIRIATGNEQAIMRLGPELKLGAKTNISYGHALNGASHQVLMTSNLRF